MGKVNNFIQGKVTKKFHNEGYFRSKQNKFKQDSMNEKTNSAKNKTNHDEIEQYKKSIIENKEGKLADEIDIKCLGEKLGVNINIVTVDANGNQSFEDLSDNKSKDTYNLKRSLDKDGNGHFEAVINGKVVPNNGDNNQCFYLAMAQIEAHKLGRESTECKLKERAETFKEALNRKDGASPLKMQLNQQQFKAEINGLEERHGVKGQLGKYDLSGGGARKPVLEESEKENSRRQFSTNSKKNYKDAHIDHYKERMESLERDHSPHKKAFQDGVRIEDVLTQGANLQENTGWKDDSKIEIEKIENFKSPNEDLANVHADHVEKLGLKEVEKSKIKDPQAHDNLQKLPAKTNPDSKESNQQIEKK